MAVNDSIGINQADYQQLVDAFVDDIREELFNICPSSYRQGQSKSEAHAGLQWLLQWLKHSAQLTQGDMEQLEAAARREAFSRLTVNERCQAMARWRDLRQMQQRVAENNAAWERRMQLSGVGHV